MSAIMWSVEYMANGNLYSMHLLGTEEEVAQHARNLGGVYEILHGVIDLPMDFEILSDG